MGNRSSSLRDAALRPDNEALVRAAFDELDADHSKVLQGSEMVELLERWKRLHPNEEPPAQLSKGGEMTLDDFRELLVRDRQLRLSHSWALLNRDVLRIIVRFLSDAQKLKASRVCSSWYKEIRAPIHWSQRHGSVDEYIFKLYPDYMVQLWFDEHGGTFRKEWPEEQYIEGFLTAQSTVTAGRKPGHFTLYYSFTCESPYEDGETFRRDDTVQCRWGRDAAGSLKIEVLSAHYGKLGARPASIIRGRQQQGTLEFSVATFALQEYAMPWMESFRSKRNRERTRHNKASSRIW